MTSTTRPPTWTRWRSAQLVLGVWLLGSALLYPPGVAGELVGKDLLVGIALLVVTGVAAVRGSGCAAERATCLVAGCLLLAGALVLDDGVGTGSLVAQANEVAVAVLLVCLAAARTRA